MGRKQKTSLTKGRPPLSKPNGSLSSKATRTIIRKHHNLLKAQAQAHKQGDSTKFDLIAKEIEENGGLEKYQKASQTGQSSSRGGDTSKVLKTWLEELGVVAQNTAIEPLSMLEVGCLSPHNIISGCKDIDNVRIDLHSSHPSILEQDFMQRPLPQTDHERFDMISLSLVLNFVASPSDRGEMLIRTCEFLRSKSENKVTPILFFTLPLPCVSNSRYMNEEHLNRIMSSLGYGLLKAKSTSKIYYSLWHFDKDKMQSSQFKKMEISPGGARNNFSVVINKPE